MRVGQNNNTSFGMKFKVESHGGFGLPPKDILSKIDTEAAKVMHVDELILNITPVKIKLCQSKLGDEELGTSYERTLTTIAAGKEEHHTKTVLQKPSEDSNSEYNPYDYILKLLKNMNKNETKKGIDIKA